MPPSPLPLLGRASDARTATLQGLLIATIVIGALYFGHEVLVPLALAILLSFVLTPPLVMLRKIKVPRAIAVGIVVSIAFGIIVAIGWLLSREVTQLATDLPSYRFAMSEKIRVFRENMAQSAVFQQAGQVLSDLQQQLTAPDQDSKPAAPSVGAPADKPDDKPVQVEVLQPEPSPLEVYQRIAGTVLPPLATAGIVLLFVVFILLQREDLRDRLIRLFGSSDLQRTTVTMTDAAHRLSRYFLRQVLINSAYGIFIAFALWLIGIPTPIVWGVLAMLMRFVPFVGAYIAAAMPALLALAVDPGWTTFFLTVALFVVSELIMGQAVEPLVFGRGTGVTPLAIILSTVFWTWLWGPLGLLLATPITVCLAVLGRHVEGLSFFEVLLSDKPALTPEQSFYQRALSGDAAEATYHAELCLKDQSLQSYLDDVALGGLKLAELDARRGALDDEQTERIAGCVHEMLDNLADFEPRRWFERFRGKVEAGNGEEAAKGLASLEAVEEEAEKLQTVERSQLAPGWAAVDEPVLCIGGRTVLDEAAAAMLAQVLEKRGLDAKLLPPDALSAGKITSLADTEAKFVCLSYLGLGTGPAHIRYLVKRLRRILPAGTCILIAYWAEAGESASVKELLDTTDADAYANSLEEAVDICLKAAKGELPCDATDEKPVPVKKAEPRDAEKREAAKKPEPALSANAPPQRKREKRASPSREKPQPEPA
jgi:predicted PurR-regulated permease PerM